MTDNPNNFKFKFFSHLDKDLKEMVLNELKIMWTYTSNAIEGNTLTWGDTKFIIEEGLTVKGKSIREHNEVIGHIKAIDILYSILDKEEIIPEYFFDLHKAIQTGVIVDVYSPIGAWKNDVNGVYAKINGERIFHQFSDPKDVSYLMNLWLNKFKRFSTKNEIEDLIGLYADMHISFVSIHPFFDGNGRIARLISNLPLLHLGYPPILIRKENREEYIRIISHYTHLCKSLNKKSDEIIDKNIPYYNEFVDFCKKEYEETKKLLEDTNSLQRKRNKSRQ